MARSIMVAAVIVGMLSACSSRRDDETARRDRQDYRSGVDNQRTLDQRPEDQDRRTNRDGSRTTQADLDRERRNRGEYRSGEDNRPAFDQENDEAIRRDQEPNANGMQDPNRAEPNANGQRPMDNNGMGRFSRYAGDPDKFFLAMVAMHNAAEIEAGRLAESQGSSDEVKEFGRKMVEDHGKAGRELTDLARRKGIELPQSDPTHGIVREHLTKLRGEDFDREFVTLMVGGHAKEVAIFELKAKNAKDADIRNWAQKTLPTLQEHLRMVRDISEKLGAPDAAK